MDQRRLIAYFSASGTTKAVAKDLASRLEADLHEINPAVPYSKDDLDWNNPESRSSIEMHDNNSRPAIAECTLDLSVYDTVFLGFPIWWHVASRIINSFLEQYDFSDKKIVLFATSGGSGFGEAVAGLKASVSESCEIQEGRVISPWITDSGLEEWVEELKA
ncbi:MAG: flavodoxin [Eubacteriales bacterium]|nr:flavodoxin [Eubacteriales bacterium]MDD4323754.1 flavodoxin [Eubacteriales bacterium]MDD4541496.1 flavodoxin [Eubacteriales bacterium]